MGNSTKNKINWLEMLMGILFIILAISIFNHPISFLVSFSFLFGIMAWVGAVHTTIQARQFKKDGLVNNNYWIFKVLVDVLVGFIFIFHVGVGVSTIGILFAIWFIVDSIGQLYMSRIGLHISAIMGTFSIIIAAISLALGIILLFSPIMAATVLVYMVVFYLFFFGVSAIVDAF